MTKSALSSSPCSSSLQSASGSGKMSLRPSTSQALNTQTDPRQVTITGYIADYLTCGC
jgi:hypothetical protein